MTEENEPKVIVTLADIYRVVIQTETKVQGLAQKLEAIVDQGRDHETRLRALEAQSISKKGAWTLASAAAVLAGVGTFLLNVGNGLWH